MGIASCKLQVASCRVSKLSHHLKELRSEKMLFLPLLLLPLAQPLPQPSDQMILRSVCELEAFGSDGSFNQKTAQKCVQCWPEEIVEPADLTVAKRCVRTFLPKLHAACKMDFEQISLAGGVKGGNFFACFVNFVSQNDKKSSVRDAVEEYLKPERTGLSRQKRTGNLLRNLRDNFVNNVNNLIGRFGKK